VYLLKLKTPAYFLERAQQALHNKTETNSNKSKKQRFKIKKALFAYG
jgi:hypothetical protein